ncbi:MAG: type II toxin-antitoxin system RelE/ParE family toxin [Thermoplasmata archaeon]
MTRYEVFISETARKQLRALREKVRKRIKKALLEIREDPFRSQAGANIKKLKGPKRDYYRLRLGDYRVIYTVKGTGIMVVKILHRRRAYSWLE